MPDLSYYRVLSYRRLVKPVTEQGETYFLAWIEQIPDVKADGATREEALINLGEAFDDYVTAMLEWGDPIPEPRTWPENMEGVSARRPWWILPWRRRPLDDAPVSAKCIPLEGPDVAPWTRLEGGRGDGRCRGTGRRSVAPFSQCGVQTRAARPCPGRAAPGSPETWLVECRQLGSGIQGTIVLLLEPERRRRKG